MPAVAGFIHDQDPPPFDRGRRTRHQNRQGIFRLAGYYHRREIALQDRRDYDAGNHAGFGDAEDELRVILPRYLECQRAAQLAKEGPVDFQNTPDGWWNGAAHGGSGGMVQGADRVRR